MRLRSGEFLGQPLRSYEVSGFTLTQYAYAPHADLPPHEHEHAYLSFPLNGAYEEWCGRQSRTCVAGGAVFHPRGEAHRDRFHGEGAAIFSLEMGDAWVERLREDGVACDERRDAGAAVRTRAMKLIRAVAGGSSLRIEAAAIEVLAELPPARIERTPPPWMRRVRECLAESAARPSLDELSTIAGVHPVHLARAFRQFHGCSIGEYFRALRMDRAVALVREGTMPLADVADACGFADQSHLTRAFKRATGCSPARFAKRVP